MLPVLGYCKLCCYEHWGAQVLLDWCFRITSVLNCASDRLAISSSLSCIFSGTLKCSDIWAFFFWSWRVCYLKGRSLRCSPGRGNAGCCAVTLYVGEGLRGNNGACSTLHRISSHSLHYAQSNWAPLVLVPEWMGLCTL